MNKIRWITLWLLMAVFGVPFSQVVVAGEFVDVLDTPAATGALASRGLLNGLASAGNRIVAVGERGLILYSDDAGSSWKQAQVPVASDLLAVQFPSAGKGWAVGHDGVVLHSDNAGETWTRQFDGRQVGPLMLEHYQALAAAQPGDETLSAMVNESRRMAEEGADKPFLDLWFESERVGYVVGAFNLIFRTEDGGRTWQPWMDRTENPSALNLYAMRQVGDDLFIAGEQGLVLKLDRSAARFRAVPTAYRGSFFGITGKPGSILVFGLRGNAFRSVDGGANWEKVELGLPQSITAATLMADGRIALLSQAGHLLISADDGASFRQLPQQSLVPVAAAMPAGPNRLVLGGERGVRLLSIQ